MNERIRELATQAGIGYHGESLTTIQDELPETVLGRFANLVVKECLTVLNNRFMGDLNREDLEVRRCVADVREHFGVK